MAKKRSVRAEGTYAPAQRLEVLRLALEARALGYREMMELLSVTEPTVKRMIKSLSATDAVLEDMLDGKRTFRIRAPRPRALRFTLSEIVALSLTRHMLDVLRGTGLYEDCESALEKLAATLREHDVALAQNLDRKLFVVPWGGRRKYEDRGDDVDEALTALLHEQRLEVTYVSANSGEQTFLFDPLTLVSFKTGLYFAGYSHRHGTIIKLALDSMTAVRWRKGERFEYPRGYHPKDLVARSFGLESGKEVRVVLRFDPHVVRFVERTKAHETQEERRLPDGSLEIAMTVAGLKELPSWIYQWGSSCVVVEPPELRERVGAELAKAAARYSPVSP